MFSQKIVGSDGFLELSPEAQALYFQLGMRTDDDGFIDSARSVCRMVGVGRERLDELVSGGYLLPFEGGLYCFTHWRINNTLRADRYTETVYLAQRATLALDPSGAYIRPDEQPVSGAQTDSPAPAQVVDCISMTDRFAPGSNSPVPSIPNSEFRIPNSLAPNSPTLWKCGEVDGKGKIYQENDENCACAEVNEIGKDNHFSEVFNSQNPSFFGQNLGCHSIGQARQGQAEKIKGSSRAVQRGGAGGEMFAQKIVSTPVENHRNSTSFFHSVHSPDAAQTPDSDIIGDSGAAFRKVELPCTADEGKLFSKGALCPADEGYSFAKGVSCPADEGISFPKGNLYPAHSEEKAVNDRLYPIRNGDGFSDGDSFERNGAHSVYRDSSLSSVVGIQCSAAGGAGSLSGAGGGVEKNGGDGRSLFDPDAQSLINGVGFQCSAASGAGGGVSLSCAGGGVGSGRGVPLPRSRDEPFPDGFRPPSVAEVRDFCAQSGIRVDARHFCDYYASKNWMTGDTRIKNWRNVVKSWATNGY